VGVYFRDFAAAARTAAHRFFVASIMRRRPSGLRRRFAFLGAEAKDSDAAPFFTVAHLLRCASAIRFLAATLIVRRPFAGLTEIDSALAPLNIPLSSAICSLMCLFLASKPSMAALITSLLRVEIMPLEP